MNKGIGKSKLLLGVGYCSNDLNVGKRGNLLKPYRVWYSMLERSYTEKFHTYTGVTVCEEWHDYKNFFDWFNLNYYELECEKVALDKDLLVKGNRLYGPSTCCFVPQSVNNLLLNCGSNNGVCKVGVSYRKSSSKFIAQVNVGGKRKSLGYYTTEEEAYLAYKKAKEHEIRRKAYQYKHVLRSDVYEALINYTVNDDD